MDLNKLIQWLHFQLMSQQQLDAERQRQAQLMNMNSMRGADGNIQQQGLGGIFSDSLPMTPNDVVRTQLPYLWKQMQQIPKGPLWAQPQTYDGYL